MFFVIFRQLLSNISKCCFSHVILNHAFEKLLLESKKYVMLFTYKTYIDTIHKEIYSSINI